jgi:uncharacterized protein (TIGR03435 family)
MARWTAFAALAVVTGLLVAPDSHAQSPSAAAAASKFDVTSVKPCGDASTDRKTGDVVPGGGGSSSPGRLRLGCWNVKDLIRSAYLRDANSLTPAPSTPNAVDQSWRFAPVEGGPAWIDYDRYTIDAKSEGAPGQETMRGPLMQALLEDRFKLKIHRETREVPVFELTVAEGGPELHVSEAKTSSNVLHTAESGIATVEARATSLGEFSKLLGLFPAGLGRPVIDKTGITGVFDFHLVYVRDGITSEPGAVTAPSIFPALRQIGLKLDSATGRREFLVVDHVERPSEN